LALMLAAFGAGGVDAFAQKRPTPPPVISSTITTPELTFTGRAGEPPTPPPVIPSTITTPELTFTGRGA
jgi:hypothetical protein